MYFWMPPRPGFGCAAVDWAVLSPPEEAGDAPKSTRRPPIWPHRALARELHQPGKTYWLLRCAALHFQTP